MPNDLLYYFTFLPIMYLEGFKFVVENLMPTITILLLVALMLVEILNTRCKQSRTLLTQSYLTNVATFIFNNILLSALSVSSLLLLAETYQHNGLLSVVNQPVQVLLSFILFDLTFYLWHMANHNLDFLWMFHKAHHSDKSMNVTTAFRVHLFETLLYTFVKAIFVVVIGVETVVVALCEGLSTFFIMFHHLNLTFRSEKWLKWLFIVPSLHRVHHSSLRQEHDSNYGAVFSFWDRMFHTLIELRTEEIGLNNIRNLNFHELLKFGMFPNMPESVQSPANSLQPQHINVMIAEAAYYIAENRDFASGFELMDWFEAEQKIKQVLYTA